MKFIVENAIRTAAMIAASEHTTITDNYIGDYIEASTAEEAIETAMDYIAEKINEIGKYRAEIENGSIMVYYDDEVVDEYYRFRATTV